MIKLERSGIFPTDGFSRFEGDFEDIVWKIKFKPLCDDKDFRISISCQEVGEVKLLESLVSPHHLVREVDYDTDPPFAIAFKSYGKVAYRLGQDESKLGNGDLVFIDTARSYELMCLEGALITALVIPRDAMKKRLPSAEMMAGKVLPARSGSCRIITNLMRSVFAHGGNSPDLSCDFLSTTLVEACQSAYASAFQTFSRQSVNVHAFLLNSILRYIDDNLTDSEMAPASIAATFNVSERQLYTLMNELGLTPARYIWNKRFELSRRMLLESHSRSRTISDIAYACGFNSSSHFSREFRSRFGMTPRDYRYSEREMSVRQ
ncbi:helix-turn-helix domain-containing protein [Marinobacter sp. GN3S48]|uniref:helix-turn-helix domain-containing protein n=1 Tax=Marinobacter sp. GN3S48 TaxID=3382302 RepID=UPI00387AF300